MGRQMLDKKSSVDKFKEVLGFRYGFDNLCGFCKASGVFELSFSIESFGYKFSAMGSGFLSSHFSQQSVLKLPAIIVIIDASMNMKRLIDLQRIFCGAQLVELLVCQLFIFLTKRWQEIIFVSYALCISQFFQLIRERFEANWYEIFTLLIYYE
ncbi:unnamed protein product [Brugia pahangi]|uniref:Uncharacterized protein n=1 Tax=Brugia pahangi TaxID=6280 RepID=A0A0N4SWQ1_BRUPA|nr:unnamed protein product [Brugia pahangi]